MRSTCRPAKVHYLAFPAATKLVFRPLQLSQTVSAAWRHHTLSFFYPDMPARILTLLHRAQLIVLLQEPVERALSQMFMPAGMAFRHWKSPKL